MDKHFGGFITETKVFYLGKKKWTIFAKNMVTIAH